MSAWPDTLPGVNAVERLEVEDLDGGCGEVELVLDVCLGLLIGEWPRVGEDGDTLSRRQEAVEFNGLF